MVSELDDFISHLDDDLPFSPSQPMNDIWKELEEYFDKASYDIDDFLDELLPSTKPLPLPIPGVASPEPTPTVAITDLFKSFAVPFSNDLVPNPLLNFKEKNFVPAEILLNSIRSHKVTLNCRHMDHPFEKYALSAVPSVVPLRNDFIASIDDEDVNLTLSSNIDWKSILENQHPYPGITVDAMVNNILRSCSKSQILPTQGEIFDVINLLFKELNHYIDHMSVELGDQHKCFDASDFDSVSRKLQEKIFIHSKIQTASLREILRKWMEMVTNTFVHINDQRRRVEENVSITIIDRAVEVYSNRLMSAKGNADLAMVRKEQSDVIRQAIRRVYSNCGVEFIANVLAQLDERLRQVNVKPKESSNSQKITLDDSELLIKLFVSEYVSNINQKGLQCAGICTVQQFDDVNQTCLKDIMHNFDRRIVGVSFAERNDLNNALKSKLFSVSSQKQSEFKQRTPKASLTSGLSAAGPLTTSHSVGIHFGFESLSVSCFNQANNNFRVIFGPVANVVSFESHGVFIGEILGCSFNMEKLLTTVDVDRLYDTNHGKLSVDAIIALMLMRIDEIVKQNLHTTTPRIKYGIAIPSCLSEVMQQTFKSAIAIAEVNGNILREQCAATANFIRENHQAVIKNKDVLLVTMIELPSKACDSVVYEISGKANRMIKNLRADGSEAKSRFLIYQTPGFQCELEKLKSRDNKQSRFLIYCTDQVNAIKQIKNEFNKSKVHPLKFDSIKFADGAALLSSSAIDGNSSLECPFDLRHLSSIRRLPSGANYRLLHKSINSKSQNIKEISARLRHLIENQSHELAHSKTTTKQLLIGKMKDLDESTVSAYEKDRYRQRLEKDLKDVEEEPTNKLVIEKIADDWMNNHF